MECNCTIIWNSVMGTISAIGTLFMTYYLSRLTNKSTKKEDYFTHMGELYNRIEDDLRILEDVEKENPHSFLKEQSARHIKVNSTIMICYLLRILGIYNDRMGFMGILYGLSNKPYDKLCHSKLSEKFVEFCGELRDKEATSKLYSFNNNGDPIEK